MRTAGENIKVELRNLTVNYDDFGPVFAPAIIFIHSSPFNKNVWNLQVEALKNNYRVIAYDLRGHGSSRGDAGAFSVDLFTNDLVEFMDVLGIEQAILCGLSLGSYIALNAVEKFPARFNGLVLSGAQCMVDTPMVRDQRHENIRILEQKGIDAFTEEIIRKFFGSRSFLTRREEVRAASNMVCSTPVDSILKTLDAIDKRNEYCSGLKGIHVPTMLLMGREDMITPISVAQQIQNNIPGAAMHVIEYAGHLCNLENTHEYNEHMKRFVDHVCKNQNLSRHCEDDVTEVQTRRLKV